jgi:hypothetical protein
MLCDCYQFCHVYVHVYMFVFKYLEDVNMHGFE